jgi:hypothetical protein
MKTDQVKVENEVHEYRKYLVLKNFQPSTVDMYCRTLNKISLSSDKRDRNSYVLYNQNHDRINTCQQL